MEPVAWSAMPGGTNLFPLCGGEEPGKFTPTLTGKLQSEEPLIRMDCLQNIPSNQGPDIV